MNYCKDTVFFPEKQMDLLPTYTNPLSVKNSAFSPHYFLTIVSKKTLIFSSDPSWKNLRSLCDGVCIPIPLE